MKIMANNIRQTVLDRGGGHCFLRAYLSLKTGGEKSYRQAHAQRQTLYACCCADRHRQRAERHIGKQGGMSSEYQRIVKWAAK